MLRREELVKLRAGLKEQLKNVKRSKGGKKGGKGGWTGHGQQTERVRELEQQISDTQYSKEYVHRGQLRIKSSRKSST